MILIFSKYSIWYSKARDFLIFSSYYCVWVKYVCNMGIFLPWTWTTNSDFFDINFKIFCIKFKPENVVNFPPTFFVVWKKISNSRSCSVFYCIATEHIHLYWNDPQTLVWENAIFRRKLLLGISWENISWMKESLEVADLFSNLFIYGHFGASLVEALQSKVHRKYYIIKI
jgi:hypothetical protein